MITPTAQTSLAHAQRYFREHLHVGDYYSESESVEGGWFGAGAERLGLEGAVGEKEFLALCAGSHPFHDALLTLRRNTTRSEAGAVVANRRVFYDFVFRPPKSVSMLALMEDGRIPTLHRQAVQASLAALERYAETRVRKAGACTDRRTGNIVAALFEHDTSREQDPLLHTHGVVFNATWDEVEGHWKALQTHEMFKALAYADAVYNAELTRGLGRLGYGIRRLGKSWEIAGVSREMIQMFSKRRRQIEKRLAEELAKPANANLDRHTLRDRIARDERRRKIRGADRKALLKLWRTELGPDGCDQLRRLRAAASGSRMLAKPDYAAAVAWAKELVFERKSVVRFHELLAAAARRVLGTDASIEELTRAAHRSGIVGEESGERIVSVEGLRREWSIVERAKRECGRYHPLVNNPKLAATNLDNEQREAVSSLLASRDGVTLFRGGAGTGKTFALRELARQLEIAGHQTRIATPQGQQARALAEAGMPAVTLARLLHEGQLPKGAVVILDEAGQVGGREMEALFDLARGHGARLILSGDTRQHASVEASDAMRSLEAFAGVTTTEVTRIRRQDPDLAATPEERARILEYRKAVQEASEGQPERALLRLARAGCVRETGDRSMVEAVADEFTKLRQERLDVLAVTQTRQMARDLNEAITGRLAARGEIHGIRKIQAFAPSDLHAAEKKVPESYEVGTVIRFVQRYGSLARGQQATVAGIDRKSLTLDAGGLRRRVALKYADHWEALQPHELSLGVGSELQIRANGVSRDGKKLINGERVTVKAITKDGTLLVADGRGSEFQLGRENRILELGYAVTSYSSQGRTTDAVLLADAGVAAASHRKEWYVSISRARRRIAVFTPDVEDLTQRISESGDRMLGLELSPEAEHFAQKNIQYLVHQSIRSAHATVTTVRNAITM